MKLDKGQQLLTLADTLKIQAQSCAVAYPYRTPRSMYQESHDLWETRRRDEPGLAENESIHFNRDLEL